MRSALFPKQIYGTGNQCCRSWSGRIRAFLIGSGMFITKPDLTWFFTQQYRYLSKFFNTSCYVTSMIWIRIRIQLSDGRIRSKTDRFCNNAGWLLDSFFYFILFQSPSTPIEGLIASLQEDTGTDEEECIPGTPPGRTVNRKKFLL